MPNKFISKDKNYLGIFNDIINEIYKDIDLDNDVDHWDFILSILKPFKKLKGIYSFNLYKYEEIGIDYYELNIYKGTKILSIEIKHDYTNKYDYQVVSMGEIKDNLTIAYYEKPSILKIKYMAAKYIIGAFIGIFFTAILNKIKRVIRKK